MSGGVISYRIGKKSSPAATARSVISSIARSSSSMSRGCMPAPPFAAGAGEKPLQSRMDVFLGSESGRDKGRMLDGPHVLHQGVGAGVGVDFTVSDAVAFFDEPPGQFHGRIVVAGQIVSVGEMVGVQVVPLRRIAGFDQPEGQFVHRGTAGSPAFDPVEELFLR